MEVLIYVHAVLMVGAFWLLLAGYFVARLCRKRTWWLRFHRMLGLIGASAIVVGLAAASLDIVFTDREHLALPHAWLGLVVVTLGILTPGLGLAQLRAGSRLPSIRSIHRWSGRLLLILMAINILVGLRVGGLI